MLEFLDLRKESGFGLIHVLAVTMIASIATLGLFMSIQYARAQADLNYHTRRALLLAQGHLEEIKWKNRNLGTYGRPSVLSLITSYSLDDYDNRNVAATLEVRSSTGGNPYSATGLIDTYQDKVFVEISWRENRTLDLGHPIPEEQSIVLREDYYWKSSPVGQ